MPTSAVHNPRSTMRCTCGRPKSWFGLGRRKGISLLQASTEALWYPGCLIQDVLGGSFQGG